VNDELFDDPAPRKRRDTLPKPLTVSYTSAPRWPTAECSSTFGGTLRACRSRL